MTRVENLEEFTLMNAHHIHPREDDKIEALQFKKQLKEACMKERGTLKNIYERLAVRHSPLFMFLWKGEPRLYDAVFGYLKEHFPEFVNENIVTDYEEALIESLRIMYPVATLHGCFFHYCQAVLHKAKALGIVRQIQGNMNGRILLRKYYVLALLPAYTISETLDSLQEDMEFALLFRQLNDDIRRQWIGRVTPQHFSVYQQRH